jgi:hypothetical protein
MTNKHTITEIVVSRFNEDISWLGDLLTGNNMFSAVIYNKGKHLQSSDKYSVIELENIGGNQRDIFYHIATRYKDLAPYSVFLQAYPFDHCSKGNLYNWVNNRKLTSLEDYKGRHLNNNTGWINEYGDYTERNNSWYIRAHNKVSPTRCRYSSFDVFMHSVFEDYKPLRSITFAPGSQYLIPKANIHYYPIKFWLFLQDELNQFNSTEAHLIERALYLIFSNRYQLRHSLL